MLAENRRTGDDFFIPVAAYDVLKEFRFDHDEETQLDDIKLTEDGNLALEAEYGKFARDAGLISGEGLTERGAFVAQAMLQTPGFAAAFDATVEAAEKGLIP
jgi:hypothetical protein